MPVSSRSASLLAQCDRGEHRRSKAKYCRAPSICSIRGALQFPFEKEGKMSWSKMFRVFAACGERSATGSLRKGGLLQEKSAYAKVEPRPWFAPG